MLGRTSIELLIVAISLVAFVTDLRTRKIHNVLTFPAMALGLILAFVQGGPSMLLQHFLAAGVGFLVFSWMYALKIMGAGDVKLLMAYGALGGMTFVLDVALLSVLVGGALALLILITKRRLGDFVLRMQMILIAEKPAVDSRSKMPFGVALAVAAIWTVFASPLAQWGFRPWA